MSGIADEINAGRRQIDDLVDGDDPGVRVFDVIERIDCRLIVLEPRVGQLMRERRSR